ncbi:MAG: hypothetical protein Q9207_007991 [Kuettlingeria erythrocarpa]
MKDVPTVEGEQDWQKRAHLFIADVVGTSSNYIWEYHFKTVNVLSGWATWVEWVPAGATACENKEFAGSKRDLPSPARGNSVLTKQTPQSFLEYHMRAPGELHKHTYHLNSSIRAGQADAHRAKSQSKKRQTSKKLPVQENRSPANGTKSPLQSRSRGPTILQQRFEAAPALPILEIGSDYIFGQPKFKSNVTFEKDPNPMRRLKRDPNRNQVLAL